MQFSTALIFTSVTAVLASHGDGSGPGSGGMSMSAASSWSSFYASGSSMYPVTGLTYTKTKGSDDMTTTGVATYTMGHESGSESSHKGNSTIYSTTSTKAPAVTSGSTTSTVSVSKVSLTATSTAAQVTTNAGASFEWSAAAGLAAIAGLAMA